MQKKNKFLSNKNDAIKLSIEIYNEMISLLKNDHRLFDDSELNINYKLTTIKNVKIYGFKFWNHYIRFYYNVEYNIENKVLLKYNSYMIDINDI
tara:strand:+ start:1424 stop:1705 length:282 start_codon:yes stop_codon:yes gene_type:complete